MRNAIYFGKIFGIEVGLDYSWFIIFILITWSLAGHYLMVYAGWSAGFRWGLGLVTALLFFASILAHEFGHALVAKSVDVPVRSITLFIFGGVAQMTREPQRALHEFFIAVAGPIVSLVLALGFGALWLAGRTLDLRSLTALGGWLGGTNLLLALFNLIPGYPLDGGRVLRAIVWGASGNMLGATRLVARVGQIVAWLFILVGIWQVFGGNWANGLWIAFIGWFLNSAAASSVGQVDLHTALKGHTVQEAMMTDCPRVSPELSLEYMVNEIVLPSGRRCFPVMDGEQMLGLITLHRIKGVEREERPFTTIRQAMIPQAKLVKAGPNEELSAAMERMVDENVNQLPVVQDGRWVGMIARDNILNFIRTRAELMGGRSAPATAHAGHPE